MMQILQIHQYLEFSEMNFLIDLITVGYPPVSNQMLKHDK